MTTLSRSTTRSSPAVLLHFSSIQSRLKSHDFPEEEWVSLRTTNIVKHVNEEFKGGTNLIEILAGERSAYVILCFIAP